MESAIRICHSASPMCTADKRLGAASRVNVGLSHGCLGVSHSCKRSHRMVTRPLHVNCVLHRFSEGSKNEESEKKIARGMGAASLVLACVVGAFSLNSKMMNQCNVAYAESTTDMPISEGKRALESLEKMLSGKAPSSPPQYDNDRGPSQADVEELKLYASGLSKPGKKLRGGKALKTLQSEYEKRKDTNPESAEYLEMAIIELHLFRRDFQKASELLEKFISTRLQEESDEELEVEELEELSDEEKIERLKGHGGFPAWYTAKVFLYKAILDTVLNKSGAAKWLEAYKDTIN